MLLTPLKKRQDFVRKTAEYGLDPVSDLDPDPEPKLF
jgi:hypothetical protein